ncbi:hypothetical protein GCM10020221_09180 [Streptomyces thioluteus]|uniref:Uncharacterized protein n=1 Tax=Streptomyces thioluteus TaxID=66431 RepID=A0ABN3WHJ3_STRTU
MVLVNSVSIQRVWDVERVGGEGGVGDHGAVEGDGRGHALDAELAQRAGGALEGLLAGGAGDDQLGEEGVPRPGR